MAYSVRPNGAGVNKRLFGGCFSGLAATGQDTIVHEAKKRIILIIYILGCLIKHKFTSE